ncbi:carbohydrate ABC transporter permease [Brachybacterium timonense]|uniref:carbohydrate ABC transporter permease n=1 Tax=Brachybacterium timonense TaxID=2050896 RepID=UPI000D0AD9A1|nr:sugar ABC transporter permease [Brachybacterium timonense]
MTNATPTLRTAPDAAAAREEAPRTGSAVDGQLPLGELSADLPDHAARQPTSRSARRRRQYLVFALFAFPNLALLLVFSYLPVVANIGLSFTRWDMIAAVPVPVGLSNWEGFFTDPQVLRALRTTLIWVAVTVGASMLIGLAMAALFNARPPLGRLASTVSFTPYVLSGAAIGALWLFIFDPRYGLMRLAFDLIGQASPAWMTSSTWALPGLLIVAVWQNVGFVALVYLAALRGIPQDVKEAAALDGANAMATFRHVVLPLLSPTTFFLLITQTIGAFQSFDLIAMMTGGGPSRSTTTLSWFIYEQGFQRFDLGMAATASVFMFVLLMAITALQFLYAERKVTYS